MSLPASAPTRRSSATLSLYSGVAANDVAAVAEGADPREYDMFNYCALVLAGNAGSLACCRLILDVYPQEASRGLAMFQGGTPMHFACRLHDPAFAAMLLPLADLRADDELGNTPMAIAAIHHRPALIDSIADELARRGEISEAANQLRVCLAGLASARGFGDQTLKSVYSKAPLVESVKAKLFRVEESIALDAVADRPASSEQSRAPRM